MECLSSDPLAIHKIKDFDNYLFSATHCSSTVLQSSIWLWICPFLHTYSHVQHTSLSPNGKLLVIVGDNPQGLLVDAQTGKVTSYFMLNS